MMNSQENNSWSSCEHSVSTQGEDEELYGGAKNILIDTQNELEMRIHQWLDTLNVEMTDPLDKKDAYYHKKRQSVFKQLFVKADSITNISNPESFCVENSPKSPPQQKVSLSLMHSSLLLKRKSSAIHRRETPPLEFNETDESCNTNTIIQVPLVIKSQSLKTERLAGKEEFEEESQEEEEEKEEEYEEEEEPREKDE